MLLMVPFKISKIRNRVRRVTIWEGHGMTIAEVKESEADLKSLARLLNLKKSSLNRTAGKQKATHPVLFRVSAFPKTFFIQ